MAVERVALDELFAAARALPADAVAPVLARARAELADLDSLEPAPVDGTLRLYEALRRRVEQTGFGGVAVRCWPETFTEMGCAVCGAMGMLSADGVPAACEANVMGNVTSLLLQAISDAPPFLVDLVDIDATDDSAVLWHCGLAPRSMANPATPPRADIHANRKKPLLQFFALRPGRVTVARLRQALTFGRMTALARRAGRPAHVADAQIAAVAAVHDLTVATRDIADFADFGVALVNPFEAA